MEHDAPRQNLAISAYHALKQDIIRGRYAPEEKLLMSRLKEYYGVSTGPLREALSQLVADRLVVAISQRGYRVAAMSLAELNDIYDARAQLEGLILRLAIERGDDDWEATVLATAHRLAKVTEVSSPTSCWTVGICATRRSILPLPAAATPPPAANARHPLRSGGALPPFMATGNRVVASSP